MSTNINQFLKELKVLEQKINNKVSDVIKDVAHEIFKALLEPAPGGTPVDTGHLRSNWIISVDMLRPFPVGSKLNVDTGEQKRSLSAFLNESTNRILKASNIYINNGVRYASFVNDGTDTRPALNFVQKSIQRGAARLKRNRIIK